jgi:signal transduction histidine kinase/ligand-binding sensor domain-containing protein
LHTNGALAKYRLLKEYSYKDGLNTYNIKKVLQDKNGFIWVGTQDGLYRYDGLYFEVVKKFSDSKNNYQGNFVSDFEIIDSMLIVSWYQKGIDVISTNSLQLLFSSNTAVSIKANAVWHIRVLAFNHIMFSTNSGLFSWRDNRIRKLAKSTKQDIQNSGVYAENKIFYTTQAGQLVFNNNTYTSPHKINYAVGYKNGILFLENGIAKFIDSKNSCTNFGKTTNRYDQFYSSYKNNNILFLGENFLGNLNATNNTITYDTILKETPNKFINYVFSDNSNLLWVATSKSLEVYTNDESPFAKILPVASKANNIEHYYSMDSFDKNTIVICGINGLNTLDVTNRKINNVHGSEKLGTCHTTFKYKNKNFVSSDNGIFEYEKSLVNGKKLCDIYAEFKPYNHIVFNAIINLGDTLLLFGAEDEEGLIKWEPNMKKVKQFKYNNGLTNQIPENHIHNLKYFNSNFIWLLQDGSISKYFFRKDSFSTQKVKFNSSIYFDLLEHKNKLYVTTYSGGVNVIDNAANKIKYITEQTGLCNNSCYCLLQESDSAMWVSTNFGLSRINLSNYLVENYFENDGLHSNAFEEKSACKFNGKIYFSGVDGVTEINTDLLKVKREEKKYYFKSVKYFVNQNMILQSLLNYDAITIPPNATPIEIVLAKINFKSSKGNFMYSLDNENWLPVGVNNIIRFDKLVPGSYIVNLKYNNQLGEFEPIGTSLKLNILPPWYQTWWFKILMALLILLNGFLMGRLYFKRKLIAKQKELEKQQALQNERERIASDMHDDLGSGLSSIKLISSMLKNKYKDAETQNELNEIVDGATSLTDSMREMVWSLNPRNDKVDVFISHMKTYGKQFFEPTIISIDLIQKDEIPSIDISSPVRRNLFLCFKEILNNIVKHANAKNVIINFSYSDKIFKIQIQDDGKGLSENMGNGNGMYTMKKRISDCNGNIEFKALVQGLEVFIMVPLQ